MTLLLRNPNPFPERLLLFGGGGAGKTEALLQIARHIATGTCHVYENDVSFAWNRALATVFRDVDTAGKVQLHESTGTWEDTLAVIIEIIDTADDEHDWLMLDSITPTWEQVRSWYLQQVYGEDAAQFLINLKAQFSDDMKGYSKALSEAMNYDVINKEYNRLYNLLFKWKGNLAVTAEATTLSSHGDNDEKMLFGHLGFKPAGQKKLHHIGATNIMLSHTARGVWKANTAKDRGRQEYEHEVIDDFALDYLVPVAGWMPVAPPKKGPIDTDKIKLTTAEKIAAAQAAEAES